jgi:hypothetical protein
MYANMSRFQDEALFTFKVQWSESFGQDMAYIHLGSDVVLSLTIPELVRLEEVIASAINESMAPTSSE